MDCQIYSQSGLCYCATLKDIQCLLHCTNVDFFHPTETPANACYTMMSATTALSQFPGARMPNSGEKEMLATPGGAPLAPISGWGQTLPKPSSTSQMDLPEILWTDDIIDDRSTRSTAYSMTSSQPESLDKHSLGKQSMDSLDKQSLDRHSLASTAKSTKSQLSRGQYFTYFYSTFILL